VAWIELHQSVWTHRKTMILAAELDIPEVYAAAHMAHLWCWALDNAPTGDLTGLPAKVIAKGAAWPGDPSAFVEAAVAAGYIDRDGDSLRLHNWEEYAGRLIEHRRKDRERKRRKSQEPPQEGHGNSSGTPAEFQRNSDGTPSEIQRNSGVTQPNPTVPNPTENVVVVNTRAGAESDEGAEDGQGEGDAPVRHLRFGPDAVKPSERIPQEIRHAFMEVTGRELMPGETQDVFEAMSIATTEQIVRAIRIGAQTFRPRYQGDGISSFRYFLPVVRRVVAEDAGQVPVQQGRQPPQRQKARDLSFLEQGA